MSKAIADEIRAEAIKLIEFEFQNNSSHLRERAIKLFKIAYRLEQALAKPNMSMTIKTEHSALKQEIIEMRNQGKSYRQISRKLGVPTSTVYKIFKRYVCEKI